MRRHERLVFSAILLFFGIAVPLDVGDAQSAGGPDPIPASGRGRREVPVAPRAWEAELSVGSSAFTLDSTDMMASAGESFSAVLAARVPGLSVLRPGGSAAEGSRIRLRGPRSFLTTTEPVVVVDGIRLNAMQEASVIDAGVRVSRLDDIAPEDVARLDVLPGPAAASLFGPGAAGGALVITTKRGHHGPLHWTGRAESRVGLKPTRFPANYYMNGISTATGGPAASCDVHEVSSGACTPTRLDVWNPLEQASPFRIARAAAGGMSISGGVAGTAARIGAIGRRTLGATVGDDEGRLGLRADLGRRLGEIVDVGVRGGYLRTSAGLPFSGNRGGVLSSGLFGRATDDSTRGYRLEAQAPGVRQRATHWHTGGSAAWRPRSWLTATVVYGRDELEQGDHFVDVRRTSGGSTSRFTRRGDLAHATTTLGTSIVAAYSIAPRAWIGGTTTAGYERLGSTHTASEADSTWWDSSSDPLVSSSSVRHGWSIDGPWLRQQFAWRNRLFVGGALRLERRRAFGEARPGTSFKSANASWSVGRAGSLREVRLRGAYGEAGSWMAGNPGVLAAGPLFTGTDASMLDPVERTAESELGVDARLSDVLSLALTAFRVDASKLYVVGPSGPSVGFGGAVVSPVGSIQNDGVELTADARLLDAAGLHLDVTLTAAALRNRVRSVGGLPSSGGTNSRTAPGYPVASYWTRSYSYADANGNGVIEPSEVQFTDTAVFVGSSLPTREASVRSALSLPGRLTAAVLFDYRGGHKLLNSTERARCRAYRNCRGAQDPSAPRSEQAKYAAIRTGLGEPFISDASFVKLREASMTWIVPARWASRVAGGPARVTLAGRNVATWTRYDGIDPELDYRRFDELPRAELAKLPHLRELIVKVEVGSR